MIYDSWKAKRNLALLQRDAACAERPVIILRLRDVLGDENVLLATENIGEATRLAPHAVQAWLGWEADEPSPAE